MTVHTALLAFLGGDEDDDDFDDIAALLGTEPTSAAVERELESLSDAVNTTYGRVKDQLDSHRQVPVDAGPREKAEAIERAVRVSKRQSSEDGAADAVVRAATAVREDAAPRSTAARRFLDSVADGQSLNRQLADVFQTVAERLDEYARAESALDSLDADAGVDSVPDLVAAYRDARREQQANRSGRDRLTDAVESLLDELDVDADGTLEQRVRSATREVRSDAGERGEPRSSLDEALVRARNRANPRSRRARRLFDALENDGDVESALEAAADRLDEAATADALLENVDREDVTELAASVADDCANADSPVADAVRERAIELGDRVERADDSNRVVAFAAHEELTFYRRGLLERAFEVDESGGSGSLEGRLAAVRERREAIERDYVDSRSDHNHSIPLYFLSLVDTAVEDASDHLNAGRSEKAAGALGVVEELLDHVEGLYEQNQYSVMLRSLRG